MTPAVGHHDVEQFRALIADRLGLSFDDSKLGMLAEALRRRIEATNGAGESYLKRLAGQRCPSPELRALAQTLTVTETYFFRNADQIRAFVEIALPPCLAGKHSIRVLSAGCASGDEPYSLAIAVREHAPEFAERVSIVALDVNPVMLEKARRATYNSWSLRELPAELRARWFRTEANGFVLDDAIRQAVSFEERNLMDDDAEFWQPQSWDIVFCRNVLMYFAPALAQTVVARIARALAPAGYLFLGHAETLRGLSNDFHLCHTHETFYYRRKDEAPGLEIAPARERSIAWSTPPRFDDSTTWIDTVRRASERIHALADLSQELAQLPAPAAAPSARALPDLHRTLDLLHSERFAQALEQLDALPAEHARDPDVLLLKAVSLSHSGALTAAERVCRELLRYDELNAGAYYVLALCREGANDITGALEYDRIALYLDAGFAMVRLHLGLMERRRGERESARRELAQALTLLQQEDAARLLLFGGGFNREALIALCRAELVKCGVNA